MLALVATALTATAQAPILQDGADALRRARLDWTAGDPPLGPSSLPFLAVGWGGATADGATTPLLGGEGLGQGTQGWGLGAQGRYVSGGWSLAATFLVLRGQGHSQGVLQRAALAYQAESGWRAALEQGPLAWGSGLLGGDLLGPGARPFARLSLATPTWGFLWPQWRLEAFAGRLDSARPIPSWLPDRPQRLAAQAAGLDLQRPWLKGAWLQVELGTWGQVGLGAIGLRGGQTASGGAAPEEADRTQTLGELKVRIPALARALGARGASLLVGRSAAPDSAALTLAQGRTLLGLQAVWDGWDVGLEYAEAAPRGIPDWTRPAHLADFSTQGDALGPAFGRKVTTRTLELGLPLPLEGRGTLRLVRATSALDDPAGRGTWFLQEDAQWRTPTGRLGLSLASRRQDALPGIPRWGWALSVFQGFRVF